MPSRRNVAKYEIEHSAWIGSSEIPVDYQSPHNGQTQKKHALTRTKIFFPVFFNLFHTMLPFCLILPITRPQSLWNLK